MILPGARQAPRKSNETRQYTPDRGHGDMRAFTRITHTTPSTAILATCRLIDQEAQAIMDVTGQIVVDSDIPDGPAPLSKPLLSCFDSCPIKVG